MAQHSLPTSCAAAQLVAALVAATFVATPGQVRAQCPAVEITKLIGADTADNDQFGVSVDIDGDTAIVGAHGDDNAGGTTAGAAYVFIRSGGAWIQQAKLTASDAASGDTFGASVAIEGDTAVVTADQDDHAGGVSAGSAYVFIRMDGVWSQQAKLVASDAAASDRFGNAVSLSGDTVVVGAGLDDHTSLMEPGAAYVFTRCNGSWSQQAKLTASDAANGDRFGASVAIDQNWVVVGANSDDHVGGANAGSAYVFVRAGTLWTQTQKLTASDAAMDDFFGDAVSISADTLVIGAPVDDHAGGSNAGSAYVFVRLAGVWSQQAKLTASDAEPGELFGYSVDMSGDAAVLGAQADEGIGSAYVFARSGVVWSQQAKLLPPDGALNDAFGSAVALSETSALVGAHQDTHAGGMTAGSAYWFDVTCDDDGDGIPNSMDVCPMNAAGLPVDCAGRPLRDCNLDCVVNGADIACITDEMLGL
ncbi:MAG: FG-GAP repeat protein [Planctomycetota bacterium]